MEKQRLKAELSEKYRSYLQLELDRILQKNPNYSLRSFARKLKVNPGVLSALLNGNRPVTTKMFKKLSDEMGLSPVEKNKIENNQVSVDSIAVFEQHVFDYFSHWYFDAFLELAQLPEFENEERWIARRLGIGVPKVKEIKSRLIGLGFIEEVNEKIKVIHQNSDVFALENTSPALKRLQMEANELSRTALEHDELNERYHATNTISVDRSKVEEAKEALREFRRKFCVDLKKQGSPDSVYQLNISLYRLDHG